MYESSIGRAVLTHTLPDLLISSQYCAGSSTGSIAPGDSGGPSILRYLILLKHIESHCSQLKIPLNPIQSH